MKVGLAKMQKNVFQFRLRSDHNDLIMVASPIGGSGQSIMVCAVLKLCCLVTTGASFVIFAHEKLLVY